MLQECKLKRDIFEEASCRPNRHQEHGAPHSHSSFDFSLIKLVLFVGLIYSVYKTSKMATFNSYLYLIDITIIAVNIILNSFLSYR